MPSRCALTATCNAHLPPMPAFLCPVDAEVRRHFGAFGPIAEVKLYRKVRLC